MYESRFGISGPPFQLSPDPSFYFDSRGHHDALAELRRGLMQRAGFIVISGEIGAGKTTLVRTLLGELDTAAISVAHIVSTQLDADELMGAMLIGFGVKAGAARPQARAFRLLRLLATLRNQSRRAVLIIDEAQNLRRDALDQLVGLAEHAALRELPLQVCLVGQPELRAMIETPDLLALKRLVCVSCHLGPIDRGETGGYIEHRLRTVGWTGNPSFEPGAFDEIHRWTGGVPRRINLLCNRLMLSRFFASENRIDVPTVVHTARELRAEFGEAGDEPLSLAETPPPAQVAPTEPRSPSATVPALTQHPAPDVRGCLLCVVAGHGDHIKAAALMRGLSARRELPPVRLARAHKDRALEVARSLFAPLDLDEVSIDIGLDGETDEEATPPLTRLFESVVDRLQPHAVIVFDGSDAALVCGTGARQKGIPVVHIGAGLRVSDAVAPGPDTRRLTDELADLLYTPDVYARETLVEEGIPAERVHCAGNLLIDAVQMALAASTSATHAEIRSAIGPLAADRNGYALVVLGQAVNIADRQSLVELLQLLRDVSRDVPLVWPMHPRVASQLNRHRLEGVVASDRIARLPLQPYTRYVTMLRHATCVLTDSWNVQEEATALGVPCITIGHFPERAITVSIGSNVPVGNNRTLLTRAIWECIFNGGKRGSVPPLWDGKTAARIASYLCAWLPANAHGESQVG